VDLRYHALSALRDTVVVCLVVVVDIVIQMNMTPAMRNKLGLQVDVRLMVVVVVVANVVVMMESRRHTQRVITIQVQEDLTRTLRCLPRRGMLSIL
jgi:hypothetical protein